MKIECLRFGSKVELSTFQHYVACLPHTPLAVSLDFEAPCPSHQFA